MLMEQVEYLREIARRGGPEQYEYDQVTTCFEFIMQNFRCGQLSATDLSTITHTLGDVYSLNTIQGFVYQKPYGYNGDFELIDKIYQRFTSPHPHLAKWDNFAHSRRSNQAVRNRKDYFIKLIANRTASANSGEDYRVLNVGSGPARDVCEFLEQNNHKHIIFDCLDQEDRAVEYAKSVCAHHLDRVSFITANVFRFKTPTAYSLVWPAGLFDYLDDRAFRFLLKRLCSFSSPNGEIVVGNFSPLNPDQDYMAFSGWVLNHRTPEQLLELVADSGIESQSVSIKSEEEGINLFLHLKQPRVKNQASERV